MAALVALAAFLYGWNYKTAQRIHDFITFKESIHITSRNKMFVYNAPNNALREVQMNLWWFFTLSAVFPIGIFYFFWIDFVSTIVFIWRIKDMTKKAFTRLLFFQRITINTSTCQRVNRRTSQHLNRVTSQHDHWIFGRYEDMDIWRSRWNGNMEVSKKKKTLQTLNQANSHSEDMMKTSERMRNTDTATLS
jgi:hypothetical protein